MRRIDGGSYEAPEQSVFYKGLDELLNLRNNQPIISVSMKTIPNGEFRFVALGARPGDTVHATTLDEGLGQLIEQHTGIKYVKTPEKSELDHVLQALEARCQLGWSQTILDGHIETIAREQGCNRDYALTIDSVAIMANSPAAAYRCAKGTSSFIERLVRAKRQGLLVTPVIFDAEKYEQR